MIAANTKRGRYFAGWPPKVLAFCVNRKEACLRVSVDLRQSPGKSEWQRPMKPSSHTILTFATMLASAGACRDPFGNASDASRTDP